MVAAMPFPSGQGTQALVGELASGLSARGHAVHLVCYHHGFERDDPFCIHRTPKIASYQRFRSGPDLVKPMLDLMLTVKTIQTIRSTGAELVHAHNYEGALAGWLAAGICGVPIVYHAHNIMEDELWRYARTSFMQRFYRMMGLVLDAIIPPLADWVIALHRPMARKIHTFGVAKEKILIVPPGIDTKFWSQAVPGVRPSNPTLVYTGNLDAYQDLDVLFMALPEIGNRVRGARLLLATPNDILLARRLVAGFGVEHLTDIVYTPSKLQTRDALARSNVVVCPRSSWSGFPIKNINAQAAGLAVVTCRGSAFGICHGKTGLVVKDRDPKSLAAAVVDLLRHPERAAELGSQAQKNVCKNYDLHKMVGRVERVWQKMLDARA